MKKPIQRILAVALSLILALSGTPVTGFTVYAQEAMPTSNTVVLGFSTPTQVATVTLGTSYADLPLPEMLAAELDGESEPTDIPVSWADDDSYDGDTPGDYGFTGQVGAGYILADGVSAPGFTITVDADTSTPTQIIVARFDELDEEIQYQGYDPGEIASAEELPLPDTLTGADAEDKALTIQGVTWECTAIVSDPLADPIAFDPDTTNIYEFTAVLPEGYAPAEGVDLPVITVIIRGEIVTYDTSVPVSDFQELSDAITTFNNTGSEDTTITVSGDITITGTLNITNTSYTLTIKSESAVKTLTRGSPADMFQVQDKAKLILESIILDGDKGSSWGNGSMIYVAAGGTLTIKDGAVLRNNTAANGGAIYIAGTVMMEGGEISDNTASTDGGGVYVISGGTFDMSGGEISGNEATYNGGGVYVSGSGSTFTMSGGEISGNKATSDGGGVFVTGSGTFTMSGDAVIFGNKATASGGGVYFNSSGTFDMTGGLIFGQGSTASSVVYPSTWTPDGGGDGVVIRWSGAENRAYVIFDTTDLYPLPSAATVYWSIENGESGIYYKNSSNTDFIPLNVTVNKIALTDNDLNFSIPTGGVYDSNPQGIGNVTCKDSRFDSTTGGTITVHYNGSASVPTNAGTYTVTAEISGGTIYAAASVPLGSYIIGKKELTITGAAIAPKTYDGTKTATVTSVTLPGDLDSMALGTDYTATGTFNDPNVGTGDTVTVTVTLLNTAKANNYTVSGSYPLTGQSIGKATTGGVNQTFLVLTNTPKSDYSFDLSTLLPDLASPAQLGNVTYEITAVTNTDGVLANEPSTGVVTSPLTLDVSDIADADKTAVITVKITSGNYDDFSATLTIKTTDRIPVTISGVTLTDGAYTGSPYEPSGTPVVEETMSGDTVTGETLVYTYEGRDGTTYGPSPDAPANAGSYRLTISVEDTSMYVGSRDILYTITPATLAAGSFTYTAPANLTYDGSQKAAAVAFNLPGKTGYGTLAVTYEGTGSTTYNSATPPTDAGSYLVLVTTTGATNYTDAANLQVSSFTIAPAPIIGSVAIEETGGTADKIDVGDTLSVDTSALTPSGAVSGLTYQWYLDGAPVAATATYTVPNSIDSVITVKVTASGNYTGSLTSGQVVIGKIVLTGSPSISSSGTEVGSTVTFAPGGINGSYDIVWLRDGVEIAGQSGNTYTLTKDDKGSSITAKAVGKDDYTGEIQATGSIAVPATVPDAPVVTATAGNGQISADWTAPHNGGSAITGYKASIDGSNWINVSGTNHTFTGLTNGTAYTVQVIAVNTEGDSAAGTATATPKASGTPGPGNSGSSGSSSSSSSGGIPGWISSLFAPKEQWLEANSAKTEAGKTAAKEQGYVRTKHDGKYGVRAKAWAELEAAGLTYQHDTMDGKAVQVRVYISDPGKLSKDTYVSGWVQGSEVDKVRGIFEKWFINKVQVIHLDNPDAWGQEVEIAAKVDLTGMNTDNLCFYSYDKATNSYRRINEPRYWIDTNGYLHFYTELAGDIIVSEGSLEKQ